MNLKKLKSALFNRDGFWATVGVFATIIVGWDFITLALTGNLAWYGAFVFLMFIVAWTKDDIEKIIERYKGD